MKREADNNRVKRAIEHLNAAITNIRSIKDENVTRQEKHSLGVTTSDINYLTKRLEALTREDKQ